MSTAVHFPVIRIFLPAHDELAQLRWFGFDSAKKLAAHGEAPLAELPEHDALEIVLPAKRVAAHRVIFPAQAGKHREALIAQALEDRVLGDKADVLSIAGEQDGEVRLVWVCSRRWLETQMTHLRAAGLKVDHAFPEYALLPITRETTVYAQTSDGFVFRSTTGHFGLAANEAIIPQLVGNADTQRIIDFYQQPRPAACVDMLSGRLGQNPVSSFDLRTLRRATFLLLTAGTLLLLGQIIHWRKLESREADLQHDIRQTFATRFPGTPIIDPVLQWESKRREQSAQSNGDMLDAVLAVATRINAPVHPRRIEARDGLVRLTLTDTEVAQFKAQLDSAGNPESSPAEAGFTRLQYRIAR